MSPRAFICHSKEDRRSAETLVTRLNSHGVDVWIDHEQIRPGDPILRRIDEGLSGTDALILLLSKASGDSPWCRKEYEALLYKEIVSGKTKVICIKLDDSSIPALLSDKRYLHFADLDQSIDELIAVIVESKTADVIAERPLEAAQASSTLLDGLILLLLLDQFPVGVWGRSLAGHSGAYGHKEDPGSITVSQWAVDALRALWPSGDIPEINAFTEYLMQRRRSDTGAIGMRKRVGSPHAEEYKIIENCRHTAVGALYLYRHGKALDLALQSLRYVIESRTGRGAWVAIGDAVDLNADPLTTGYVLGVLRQFARENLLQTIHLPNRDLFLARYWKAGLLWLYENLLENEGWWVYRTSSVEPDPEVLRRTYCYTTDILQALPEFWLEDSDYEKVHEDLMIRLNDIWKSNGIGIPSGPGAEPANLAATAQYALACWKCRMRYPDLNAEVTRRFVENLEQILTCGESDAAGWALTITYLVNVQGVTLSPSRDLQGLRDLARVAEEELKRGSEGHILLADWPMWIRTICRERILPVTVEPP